MIANLMEFDYQGCAKRIHSDIEKMEAPDDCHQADDRRGLPQTG